MLYGLFMQPDLTGRRFGRWLALQRSETKLYNHHIAYRCRCDCGTERLVSGSQLRNGHSASCGCAFREAAAKSQRKHGLWHHKLRGTWRSMKERCYNSNHDAYARYGGRGIYVCKRWFDFALFVADNEPLARHGLTLDRRDNDGPYSPDNCHWVPQKQQARNRHNNQWIEYDGRRLIAKDWSEVVGLKECTIKARLRAGWSVERTLTTSNCRR